MMHMQTVILMAAVLGGVHTKLDLNIAALAVLSFPAVLNDTNFYFTDSIQTSISPKSTCHIVLLYNKCPEIGIFS